MAAHDRGKFDLSSSPTPSPYAQSFEVEGRRRQKGKARSADHRLISPTNSNPPTLPTQQAKMDASEEASTLVSHYDQQRHNSTPASFSGLQLHFENTSQPLDAFELTHTYLREYSQGVLDGQMMATSRSSTSHQSLTNTSRTRSDVSSHDSNESIDARSIGSNRSTQSRGIQPTSGPSTVDRSSRPMHQRQNTVSSISTSTESSSSTGGSRSRSRSRQNRINNPSLAEILSDSPPTPPHRPVNSLPTSPPNRSLNSIPSLPQPSREYQQQQQQQPEPLIRPSLARVDSPASQMSKASYSSWGTIISTSTNHTTYSLLGLRDFREGAYPRNAFNLDGANTTWPSPVSSANVGVNNAASPRNRGRHSSRITSQLLSQYPPPTPSLSSWHGSVASLSPRDQFSFPTGGYQPDDENENVARRSEESLNSNSNYSTGSSRPRTLEPQRMTRRNHPLPAVSPSFIYGEAIITEEEDNRSDHNLMETFGNALGLELTTGPIPISAPTPVVPHRTFLRSFAGSDVE